MSRVTPNHLDPLARSIEAGLADGSLDHEAVKTFSDRIFGAALEAQVRAGGPKPLPFSVKIVDRSSDEQAAQS